MTEPTSQDTGTKDKKIFVPFVPRDISGLLPLLSDGEVFITEKAENDFTADDGTPFRCAGRCVTASFALDSIAPAVIECVDALGAIDRLIFAPELTTGGKLLLDLSCDELKEHTDAVNGFFALCSCSVPYMLGRDEPEIMIVLPQEKDNCISRIYRAAMKAAAESIGEELSCCGVKVRSIESPGF
ncbi:MAG: hypothetical protein IJM42_05700 [Synergistes sp.]|nr:hypothetical protein [Synergistes sp.]